MVEQDTKHNQKDVVIDKVLIGGLNTAVITRKKLAEWIADVCFELRNHPGEYLPKLIFSSNGQGLALLGKNLQYKSAMDNADIIHADGMSIVFGSRIFVHKNLPERIATTDFFHDVAKEALNHDLKFYILGGKEEQNRNVVEKIKIMYPGIKIVGRRNGYFDQAENEDVCKNIRASGADVLWVGLGKPLQEIWSFENRNKLKGVGCIKTCGGLFAFLNNEVSRAPEWMQRMGLEWLYRMYQEPGRLMWRYISTNTIAVFRIIFFSGKEKSGK